jgi:hypothetical protein
MGKGRGEQFHNELYLRFLNPLERGGVKCDIIATALAKTCANVVGILIYAADKDIRMLC